jgi:hypothetical protein
MKNLITTLVILCVCSQAYSQQIVQNSVNRDSRAEARQKLGDANTDILVIDSTGAQVLTVGADGKAVLLPVTSYFKQVVVLNGPGPFPPGPSPLTDRGRQIQTAVAQITLDTDKAVTAKGLAALYRQIVAMVRANQIPDLNSLVVSIKLNTDTYLNSRPAGVTAAWQPVRDVLGLELTALSTKAASMAEYATLLEEVVVGLETPPK